MHIYIFFYSLFVQTAHWNLASDTRNGNIFIASSASLHPLFFFLLLCDLLCFVMAFPWVNRRWELLWGVSREENWRSDRLCKAWRCPHTYRCWSCGRWLADCQCRASWWILWENSMKMSYMGEEKNKTRDLMLKLDPHLEWQVPMQTDNTMTDASPPVFPLWGRIKVSWSGRWHGCSQKCPLHLLPGFSWFPWPTGRRCRSDESAHVRYHRGHMPWHHLLPVTFIPLE